MNYTFPKDFIWGVGGSAFQTEGAMLEDIVYTVSENFDHWILYNGGGGKGFVCVEPQCGAVNGLNHPGQHRVLQPGEKETFTLSITKEK